MAATEAGNQTSVKNNTDLEIPSDNHNHVSLQIGQEIKVEIDYLQRAQWLRAAVLGASDGLVSVASLMLGVGAVKNDLKSMVLSGFAGMVAGACSMAIGEYVSVYSQLDTEVSQMKRETENKVRNKEELSDEEESNKENLPNPLQAAVASALAFIVGALVPLLAGSFIHVFGVRVGVVITLSSVALVVFGWLGAVLGKAPVMRSCLRVLIGGCLAMAITYGLTRLIGLCGV